MNAVTAQNGFSGSAFLAAGLIKSSWILILVGFGLITIGSAFEVEL